MATIKYKDGEVFQEVLAIRGAKGDNTYTHIKYAATNPTQNADMTDTPSDWIGVYAGAGATAPTAYTDYGWFQIKGATGAQGAQGPQGIQGPAGADGTDAIASTTTGTLTVIGWAANAQTVTVTGATATNKLIITPAPSDFAEWGSCGVYASAQGVDQVTFTCSAVPSSELTANVLILN